jgi:16S rRNA (guanine527-N7)-methyltransferase
MTILELQHICSANGIVLDETQVSLVDRYAKLLLEWNAKINLISRKDGENILSRHILHSLTLRMPAICSYDFANKRVADVGTGGGLPGIPLKIVTPSMDVTLIDSIQKKIMVCNEMIASLQLSSVRAVVGRAEELAKQPDHRRKYDAVISRAVAPLDDLIKWCSGLLKPGAVLFSLKGGDLSEEIARSRKLKSIDSIESMVLVLKDYSEFEGDGKQLVTVRFQG